MDPAQKRRCFRDADFLSQPGQVDSENEIGSGNSGRSRRVDLATEAQKGAEFNISVDVPKRRKEKKKQGKTWIMGGYTVRPRQISDSCISPIKVSLKAFDTVSRALAGGQIYVAFGNRSAGLLFSWAERGRKKLPRDSTCEASPSSAGLRLVMVALVA